MAERPPIDWHGQPRHSADEAPISSTLFTPELIAEMADDVTSEADVRRQLGVKEDPQPERVIDAKPGASVHLGMRAMAVADIMDSFNHTAKLSGAKQNRGVGDGRFNTFYQGKKQDPDAWYAGMQEKNAMLKDREKEAYEILSARDAMLRAGFSEDEARASYNGVRREASDYQPGAATPKQRKKQVEKTAHTADVTGTRLNDRPKKEKAA